MTSTCDRVAPYDHARSCPELDHTSSMTSALACLVLNGPAATGTESVATQNGT
jgi:hypothetical protein